MIKSIPPRRQFLLRITAILYMIVLFTLTHLPRIGPIPPIPGKDKTLHFLAYLVATVLILLGFGFPLRIRRTLFLVSVLAIFAAMDELTQPWVNRSCDFYDWLADVAGILTGLLVVTVLFLVKRRTFLSR